MARIATILWLDYVVTPNLYKLYSNTHFAITSHDWFVNGHMFDLIWSSPPILSNCSVENKFFLGPGIYISGICYITIFRSVTLTSP